MVGKIKGAIVSGGFDQNPLYTCMNIEYNIFKVLNRMPHVTEFIFAMELDECI